MYFQSLVKKSKGQVFIIAEACDNHMGSLEIARSLCRVAKNAGADAIKFQHHIPHEEMLRSAEMSDNFDEHLYDFLLKNALSLDQHFELKNYCESIGILYLCTPFSLEAAKQISELVPFFKIGSGEFQDRWFIDGLIKIGKPTIFSTGMTTYEEIIENVEYLTSRKLSFALLNCLSEYPPLLSDMNLRVITNLKKDFPGIVIGHSDHSQTIFTSVAAVLFGAKIIEKHITLSAYVNGPDKDVSLDPKNFSDLVLNLRSLDQILGDQKIIHEKEQAVRKWAYRSVVAKEKLVEGKTIGPEQICTKRPGVGIPAKNYLDVVGKKAKRTIAPNTMLYWKDIE